MSTDRYTTDTTAEALEVQLACLRRMTPQQRIAKVCEMTRCIRNMAFDAIRRRHPDFDDSQVQLRFIELTYGQELADRLRAWKLERAG